MGLRHWLKNFENKDPETISGGFARIKYKIQ